MEIVHIYGLNIRHYQKPIHTILKILITIALSRPSSIVMRRSIAYA
jgi:hypothetical protein